MLGAVRLLDGKFGLGVPIRFLMGRKEDRISPSYMRHSLYGSGKDETEKWWKAIGESVLLFASHIFVTNLEMSCSTTLSQS